MNSVFNQDNNDSVNVYKLNIKSLDFAIKEIESMTKSRTKKLPISASIRDFLCCLVVFDGIDEMLLGFKRLKKFCKKKKHKKGDHDQCVMQICHIDDKLSNCKNKIDRSDVLENFRF